MGIKHFVLFTTMLGLASMVPGSLDFGPQAAGKPHPVVRFATRSDTTIPVREMPTRPPAPVVLGQIFVKPLKRLPNRVGSAGPEALDPVLQETFPNVVAPATDSNFEGVDNVNFVLPPDTVGDIGPDHYIQMVNIAFAIYDRTGNLLHGPVDNSTLWTGFGGPCETTNDGDPIVLYDQLADRWMMSQFALLNFPFGPFYQCIAVSQTPDPLGEWYLYEFLISDNKLNDYPKFGVWPDGYYMAVNQFKCNFRRCRWGGQGVVAFERDQMLDGLPARMVYFDLQSVDSDLGGMLPADLDGPEPPAGAPNPFLMVEDDAWGPWPDRFRKYDFHVDWSNPANSTFTFDRFINTAPFDSNLCGYSRNCIPQPGGTAVDTLSDRLMNRLQYRNFGAHQSMVVNHTVDVGDFSNHAGVRWYELRDSGGGWSIRQQGTYAPDPDHRWMASAAMNGAGDIALGYSVSSESVYPSIRYTGRLVGDPLGNMTQGEGTIIAGSGYQTHSSGRWGDYSSMSVDPVDDCTFWYTQEYYQFAGTAPWQTRIGSFKFADCAPVNNNNASPVLAVNAGLTVGEGASGTITTSLLEVTDADNTATEITFTVTAAPANGTVRLDGSATSNFTQDDIDNSRVSYLHDGSETSADSFDFAVSDGAGGSIASTPFSITVTPFNDDPVLATNDGLTVANNAAGTITTSLLEVTDADNTTAEIQYTVTALPGNGTLLNNASPVALNGTFTQADVDSGLISYQHDGSDTASDSFDFEFSDGIVANIGPNTFDITVTPVGGGTTMHVGDLDASGTTSQGSTWSTTVTITVHDLADGVLAGALVSGSWTGSGPGDIDCTTDGTGQCAVSHNGIHGKKTTFAVDNITHAVDTYDAAANHDPDGDSDGTSIKVNSP